MAIRAIFLDMDHTLCDTHRADQLGLADFQQALTADFENHIAVKIGEKYLKVIYGHNRNLPGWQKAPGDTEIEYRAKLLNKTMAGVTKTNIDQTKIAFYTKMFMDLRIKHFSFFPNADDMLRELKTKFKLILVSNGPLFSQEPKIKKVAMNNYVHDIILGGALEHEKPHASIFELACQKANCNPSEAIHVGDKLETDIKGANDFGLTSVWINPEALRQKPKPIPHHTIGNICELKQLLTKIA